MIRMPSRAALALACALAAPVTVFVPVTAYAAEVATVSATAVILSAGQWIVAVFQTVNTILLPFLVTIIGGAVARLYPWVRLLISDALVEASLRKRLDYATNAVEGATKDQT